MDMTTLVLVLAAVLLTVVLGFVVLVVALVLRDRWRKRRQRRATHGPNLKDVQNRVNADKRNPFQVHDINDLGSDPQLSEVFQEAELVMATQDQPTLLYREFTDVVDSLIDPSAIGFGRAYMFGAALGLDGRQASRKAMFSMLANAVEYGFHAGRAHQAHGYSLPTERTTP